MSKLRRDSRAFVKRTEMGNAEFWLIVEGCTIDPTFYAYILNTVPEIAGKYEIWLTQQLKTEGQSAGGKRFALRLFNSYKDDDSLVRSYDWGERHIAFALDRDGDDLRGTAVEHAHVIYTEAMDVEAEIIRNSDIERAVSSTYSIAPGDARLIAESGEELLNGLARAWRDWTEISIVSHCLGGVKGLAYASLSTVNVDIFGPSVQVKVDEAWVLVEERGHGLEPATILNARDAVALTFAQGREWSLVKGKWVGPYVDFLVSERLAHLPRRKRISPGAVVDTCLATLDFASSWADRYRAAFASAATTGPDGTALIACRT